MKPRTFFIFLALIMALAGFLGTHLAFDEVAIVSGVALLIAMIALVRNRKSITSSSDLLYAQDSIKILFGVFLVISWATCILTDIDGAMNFIKVIMSRVLR